MLSDYIVYFQDMGFLEKIKEDILLNLRQAMQSSNSQKCIDAMKH